MRLRPMGEAAILVELPDAPPTLALYRRLRADLPPWVVDLVPAESTVLVVTHPGSRTAVETWLRRSAAEDALAGAVAAAEAGAGSGAGRDAAVRPVEVADGRPASSGTAGVVIPVRYDGPDLAEVADLLGITPDEVVAAHTGAVWTAAFIGFAPGFAYLRAADGRLDVPRRASPRPAVPAGAVALAAGYCGVYPRESPGGWHLIGSTGAVLWDANRADPALLAPGTEVEFRRVG